jgi:acyl phosphate:glycerol-3-phosphate acyltransferase
MLHFLIIAAFSYLLGSIPFGYLLVRIFRGQDIRRSGSGNIGATNVSRTSPALGALTLILDAAKGFVAVQNAVSSSHFAPTDPELSRIMALAALFAIIGHMFPLWLGFRGGKGVATALGAFLRLNPLAVLVAIVVFVMVVIASRRISLGSIVTAAAFPVAVWWLSPSHDAWTITMIVAAAMLVIVKHQQNIRRLIAGEEPRFSLSHKR